MNIQERFETWINASKEERKHLKRLNKIEMKEVVRMRRIYGLWDEVTKSFIYVGQTHMPLYYDNELYRKTGSGENRSKKHRSDFK